MDIGSMGFGQSIFAYLLVMSCRFALAMTGSRFEDAEGSDLLPLANTIVVLEKTLVVRDTVLSEDETKRREIHWC